MKTFNDLCERFSKLEEKLTIVKKANWNIKDPEGEYNIEINDSPSHDILDRIKDRTDVSVADMNVKLRKGVDLILHKVRKGFFKRDVSFVELTYTKSNFKVIFMVKPLEKYIRISSIFAKDMYTKNALKWEISEAISLDLINENTEYDNIELDINL